MSYNIYASSPGILVTAADFIQTPTGPVVLLPYASTIGNSITVKDVAGQASILSPITISTILDSYYERSLSTAIISSVQITSAGGSITVTPLQPRTYTLLDGPLIVRQAPSALRPNYERISTISTYTASVLSSLTLEPTVSLETLLSFSAPATLTADFTSTLARTSVEANNFYSASNSNPFEFLSTGSISTNSAFISTFYNISGLTASNYTGVGIFDICGTALTTVGGNYSTIAGGILTMDSLFRVSGDTVVQGSMSTVGALTSYGTGGISIRDGFTGPNISTGAQVVHGSASHQSNVFVGGTSLLSTLTVHSSAAYTSSIRVGENVLQQGQACDVSGSMFVSENIRNATTLNTAIISTTSLLGSTFNVYDRGTATFPPLYIQGSNLYYAGSQVGGGGVVADYSVTQTIVSSFISTAGLYASTAFIGGSTYRTTFNLEVNGGIKIVDASATRLRVAGGAGSGTTTLAWSTDGLSWTVATAGGFTTTTYGLGWNGRRWLALGADTGGQTIQTSTDGKSWSTTGITNPFATEGHAAAWNGERWVAVGAGAGLTTIKTSTDGLTWTDVQTGGFSNIGYDVAWNGRLWLAVGDSNNTAHSIQYSYDSSNWSNATSGSFDLSGGGLAWNGRVWVATGSATTQNARIKWSSNGLTWTDSSGSTAFSVAGTDVMWSGQVFLASGNDATANNRIKYSYDGSLWSNSTAGLFTGNANAVVYDGDKWISAGIDSIQQNQIKYSYNGVSWSNSIGTVPPFTANTGANAVAYGYDTVPRLQVDKLEFYEGVQPFLVSTNTIFTQASRFIMNTSSITHSTSMVINNTLFINPPTGVSINIDPSIVGSTIALYVYGSTFTNNATPLKLGGGSWISVSDGRLKDDIPMVNLTESCMNKMCCLKPKEYNMKKETTYVNREAIRRRNEYIQNSELQDFSRTNYSSDTYNKIKSKLITIDLTKKNEVEKELGFIAEEVGASIPEAIEPIQIDGQQYMGLNYEQIQMVHLATTHSLMSTLEIQESTLKGQDQIIEDLYSNYSILSNFLQQG